MTQLGLQIAVQKDWSSSVVILFRDLHLEHNRVMIGVILLEQVVNVRISGIVYIS